MRSVSSLPHNRTLIVLLGYNIYKQMQQVPDKNHSKSSTKYFAGDNLSRNLIVYIALTFLSVEAKTATSITDNTCVFKDQGNLFTLTALDRIPTAQFYRIDVDPNTSIIFNFCDPFIPVQCTGESQNHQKAYSFLMQNTNNHSYQCVPYSSDSKTHYFNPQYIKEKGQIKLNLSMSTKPLDSTQTKTTDFILDCQQSDDKSLRLISSGPITEQKLIVYGSTPFACPAFELNSLWRAIGDNLLIFGIILFIIGFIMLFFGFLMTHLMIFITAYFLSFSVLALIASSFLRPDSSTVTIYFALLIILFTSTLIAYVLARLVNVSIFFIGAFSGFILAAIVNSIFCKLFNIYSIWSLIIFEVIFTIPLGLLTFKYCEQIIVFSTSLAGAYMMVRPFSWILGGFPNQFTLQSMLENGQIRTLPWSFFIYIFAIFLLAALGARYQLLKIKRRDPKTQIQTSFIISNVEVHMDKIRQAVENMITKYSPEQNGEEYKKMEEMEEINRLEIKKQDLTIEKQKRDQRSKF